MPQLVLRELLAEAEILGYHVPAHMLTLVNAWAICRDLATLERAEELPYL